MRFSLFILSAAIALNGQPAKKLLFRNPALTSTHIIFVHAGEPFTTPMGGIFGPKVMVIRKGN